jgi:hypothetical protein
LSAAVRGASVSLEEGEPARSLAAVVARAAAPVVLPPVPELFDADRRSVSERVASPPHATDVAIPINANTRRAVMSCCSKRAAGGKRPHASDGPKAPSFIITSTFDGWRTPILCSVLSLLPE